MKRVFRFNHILLVFILGFIVATTSAFGQKSSIQLENATTLEDEPNCLNVEYPKSKATISFGVINAKAIDIPKPAYPKAARVKKISGEVKVGVIIDEEGEVAWGRIETGHPLLRAAVRKVVCQATFKPQMLSNTPVAIRGIIIYRFRLK